MKKITMLANLWLALTIPGIAQEYALDFDGTNDYVDCGNGASLQISVSVTVEAWAYRTVTGANMAVASKLVHAGDREGYSLEILDDNTLWFGVGNNWSDWSGAASSTELEANEWYHLAGTYDGSTVRVYINGVLAGSQAFGNGITDSQTSLFIGCRTGSGWFFPGRIEEVRIWDSARSEEQIRESMCRTLIGNEANLVAYYPFNDGSGIGLTDLTTNNNDGTLTNMDEEDWVASTAFNTWLGGADSEWTNTANWSLGTEPAGESVGIYTSANNPDISGSPSVRNFYLAPGVSVTNSSTNITASANVFLNSDLTVPSSNTASTIAGSLFIDEIATLTLVAGSKLTLSNTTGSLNNAGTVAIQSPASLGASGSLITNGSINNTGTMFIQRWVTQGTLNADDYTWHSMGLPIASQTAGTYFTGDYVYSYDETTNSWTNIVDLGATIAIGAGYIVKTVGGDKLYTFSGTFNTGSYIFNNLTNTTNDATHGYHFVSNPYPCALYLPAVGRINIDDIFWVWDPVSNNYLSYQIGAEGPLGRYLHPCQGFFVRVSAGFSGNNQLRFDNNDRTHNVNFTTFKSATSKVPRVVVQAEGTSGRDQLWVNKLELPNKATKFMSLKTSAPQIYTSLGADSLGIINIANLDEYTTIPLYFYSSESGTYSLSLKTDSLEGLQTWLHDKLTDNRVKLDTLSAYTFIHNYGNVRNRFELFFVPEAVTLLADNSIQPYIRVSQGPMQIRVEIPWGGPSDITVYNIQGQTLFRTHTGETITTLKVEQSGIYFVKVQNVKCTEIIKTIVTY